MPRTFAIRLKTLERHRFEVILDAVNFLWEIVMPDSLLIAPATLFSRYFTLLQVLQIALFSHYTQRATGVVTWFKSFFQLSHPWPRYRAVVLP